MRAFIKKIPLEITAAVIAVFASSTVLGATLGFSNVMEKYTERHAPPVTTRLVTGAPLVATGPLIEQGHHLYMQNCAHCHAADASGADGPDLHVVKKTDERMTSIIMNGIQGEMPKFGSKLKEGDVQALLAFIHSIKK